MATDSRPVVDVVVPVLGPPGALPGVLDALPREAIRHVLLVTARDPSEFAAVAENRRATVLSMPLAGLGAAVLRGLEHLESLPSRPSVVVVLAGDGRDDPAEIPALLRPILRSGYDLVIGSRVIGPARGAGMDTVQRCGNTLAVQLIRVLYGYSYTDLSTYFAIRFPAFVALGMTDTGAGFPTELRVKALKVGLRVAEVPVACRRHVALPRADEGIFDRLDSSYKSLYQILRNATIR